MGKKNRVVATANVNLTADGTYKVTVMRGIERKQLTGISYSKLKGVLAEMAVQSDPREINVHAVHKAWANHWAALCRQLDELGGHVRAPQGAELEKKTGSPTSSAHSYNGVPFVPPMAPVLNPEAYEKSPPYWIPSSPQRLHLIELTHVQARRLQLPAPTYPDLEGLLNPFTSPVHAALNEHIRRLYQLDPILSRP